jgi:molybdopterin converting factor small subunit
MTLRIQFFSYFKELAGCAQTTETLPDGATLDQLLDRIYARFPKLAPARNATLVAVGLDYQPRTHVLKDGEEVSLFPPVQGG